MSEERVKEVNGELIGEWEWNQKPFWKPNKEMLKIGENSLKEMQERDKMIQEDSMNIFILKTLAVFFLTLAS